MAGLYRTNVLLSTVGATDQHRSQTRLTPEHGVDPHQTKRLDPGAAIRRERLMLQPGPARLIPIAARSEAGCLWTSLEAVYPAVMVGQIDGPVHAGPE